MEFRLVSEGCSEEVEPDFEGKPGLLVESTSRERGVLVTLKNYRSRRQDPSSIPGAATSFRVAGFAVEGGMAELRFFPTPSCRVVRRRPSLASGISVLNPTASHRGQLTQVSTE